MDQGEKATVVVALNGKIESPEVSMSRSVLRTREPKKVVSKSETCREEKAKDVSKSKPDETPREIGYSSALSHLEIRSSQNKEGKRS